MGFNSAKNCLALFLAVLPMFCRGLSPPECLGEDGQYYAIGELVPSSNPCEVNCICRLLNGIECSFMDCAFPPCGNPITIKGRCCPVCVGCEQDGVFYNTGDEMPSDNPCETNCYCAEDGLRACATMDCPQAPCENPIYLVGECCPRCGCQQNGQFYSIGKAASFLFP
ncbi:hypothetical protein CHS0354_030937 [Potamilus streckersoni]|uniref:VWFC domain-containing protein n=1 Tax=Potamilus streckersoni TaxID=2493646 RepID=A0AAE0RYV3_9BIVA|nr:hypothetical protein CHS0354_030937 [Potamilus streckersoni]